MSATATRILEILRVLSTGATYSTEDITQYINAHTTVAPVTRRQVQRDLKTMLQFGVPLEHDGRQYRIPSLSGLRLDASFAHQQVVALHIICEYLRLSPSAKVSKEVRLLTHQISRIIPKNLFVKDGLVAHYAPCRFESEISEAVLDTIVTAILDGKWSEVEYGSLAFSSLESRCYTVAFHRLIFQSGRLFVATWMRDDANYTILAADSILDVRPVVPELTVPTPQFDPDLFQRTRFGVYGADPERIVLHVNKSAAHIFRSRIWHPSQRLKVLKSGGLELTLMAPVTPELVGWVMSWIHVLVIVKPHSLVSACRDRAEIILRTQ